MSEETSLLGGEDETGPQDLSAGCFSTWLRRTRSALTNDTGTEVPCAECIACCTSSYFIHIGPEETTTLARINKKLLFPAPGLPKGNMLLGYDENGHCPLLIEGKCSIYAYRPLTCRIYDCRIFAAAGIAAGETNKTLINRRVKQWQFSYPTGRDSEQQAAVHAAAKYLGEHGANFPAGFAPNNSSQLAILAIKAYNVFLRRPEGSEPNQSRPQDNRLVRMIIRSAEKFDARRSKPQR